MADDSLTKLLNRVRSLTERGERIPLDDCRDLFGVRDLLALARLARVPRERRFGLQAFYVVGDTSNLLDNTSLAVMEYRPQDRPEEYAAALSGIRTEQDADGRYKAVVLLARRDNTAEEHLAAPTAAQTLRMTAIARLSLDNVPHIVVVPSLITAEVACVALGYGADMLDPTITGDEAVSVLRSDSATLNPYVELKIADVAPEQKDDPAGLLRDRILEARWKPVAVDGSFAAVRMTTV